MGFHRTATTVAFWTGALLPVVYLPVVALGIDSVERLVALLALLALNAVALVVGHDYPGTHTR